ncbi:MAG: HPr family phosphocarrier protein [bacterium]
MIENELTIVNKLGLHARAAAKFVSTASGFSSHIEVERNGRKINGKSIMGVMLLAAAQNTTIYLRIDGEDESDAMEALSKLIARKFDEVE